MPGFLISNSEYTVGLENYDKTSCVSDYIKSNEFTIERLTLNKFMLDKCMKEDDDYIVVAEGVILNKLRLFKKFSTDNVFGLIKEMYQSVGEKFFDEFRGSFSGALFIKKESGLYTQITMMIILYIITMIQVKF